MVKQIPLFKGRSRYEFEWQGEFNIALISAELVEESILPIPAKPGEDFWFGHLHLVIVDRNYWTDDLVVSLASGRGYQAYYRRKAYYFLHNIWCRLILTLMVWELAYVPPNEVPSRKHIGRKP